MGVGDFFKGTAEHLGEAAEGAASEALNMFAPSWSPQGAIYHSMFGRSPAADAVHRLEPLTGVQGNEGAFKAGKLVPEIAALATGGGEVRGLLKGGGKLLPGLARDGGGEVVHEITNVGRRFGSAGPIRAAEREIGGAASGSSGLAQRLGRTLVTHAALSTVVGAGGDGGGGHNAISQAQFGISPPTMPSVPAMPSAPMAPAPPVGAQGYIPAAQDGPGPHYLQRHTYDWHQFG